MTALLETRGVIKRFGGLTALSRVDFAVEPGRIGALIGPNGAGKTTLFNILTGLAAPDEGDVLFRGHSIVGLRPDRVTALGICRTFQNIRLFGNMTAMENVLVGMHARVRLSMPMVLARTRRYREAEAGLWRQASALLDVVALRPKANEVARSLPYGDQRRLEIARALASSPALLLLDEPTAGMTLGEARGLMVLLRRIIAEQGLTILLIEHNMPVVMEVSDHVTVLDHGERIAEGHPTEVQRNPRVVEAYLGRRRWGAASPEAGAHA